MQSNAHRMSLVEIYGNRMACLIDIIPARRMNQKVEYALWQDGQRP